MKSALISMEQLITMNDNRLVFLDATIDKVSQKIDRENIELIPNSIFFDIEGCFSDHNSHLPHTMVSGEVFTSEAQKLGINQDSIIVIYDRWGVYSSPRAWWMFRYMGHEEVYVLNGGLPAWKNAGLETATEHAVPVTIGGFFANPQKEWFIEKIELVNLLGDEQISITDARSNGRFWGTTPEPRAGVRSGHIPNSSNIPFDILLEGIYLKNVKDLEHIFKNNTDPEKRNIFTCGSGITASILALGAFEIGNERVTVYDGSWSEWGTDDQLPIA